MSSHEVNLHVIRLLYRIIKPIMAQIVLSIWFIAGAGVLFLNFAMGYEDFAISTATLTPFGTGALIFLVAMSKSRI